MMTRILVLSAVFLLVTGGCENVKNTEKDPVIISADERARISIGYIGCSNTRETVEGYHRMGGRKMWYYDKRYDSGTVRDWSERGDIYWNVFDGILAENPNTTTIWWQLCIRDDERATDYEDAVAILDTLRKRLPTAAVYVSALAEYSDEICEITGTFGIQRANELVDELVAKQHTVRGPMLGPLSSTETAVDGCHLGHDGKQKLGMQMKDFFDGDRSELTAPQEPAEVSAETVSDEPDVDDVSTAEELTFEERVWGERIDAALEPVDCPTVAPRTYPKGYYTGPLIDSHFHIPSIPDDEPREDDDGDDGDGTDNEMNDDGEEDSGDSVRPSLGVNVKITDMICTLDHEGTEKVIAFFPVYRELPTQMVEVVKRTMDRYADRFVPFIMPPDQDNDPGGSPTVDADTLQDMIEIYPDLFQGYGEIGLYERDGGADELAPDDPRLQEIYPIIDQQGFMVYFHPGDGQADNLANALEHYPEVAFLVHGDQIQPEIVELMDKYPNLYFTMNDLYGDEWLLRPQVTKQEFLDYFKDIEPLIRKDLALYEDMINKHPDRFMWGTDRSDTAAWTYDREIGVQLADYGRAFIGRLKPEVQENFAYKNVERILQQQRTEGSIGYIGCSNTRQTVHGYRMMGGRELWKGGDLHDYDGGAVADWAAPENRIWGNKFWNFFDALKKPKTTMVWWQLCIRRDENTTYEQAMIILDKIRERIPGVQVYVSSLPSYTDGECEITGTTGIERAQALAAELDSRHDDVRPGPVLGPMTPADTDADGCHLSNSGLKKLGGQMKEFFG